MHRSAHKPPYFGLSQMPRISKLDALKKIKSKQEFAELLGVKVAMLTYTLYKLKPANQYRNFCIPKKMGGVRKISAPLGRLKLLQSRLSVLLQDCFDEINPNTVNGAGSSRNLSHGFIRNRSIISHALMHIHKKNVLNIDLKDFFGCFNFGRVRGFFVANRCFALDSDIATIIAQIACHENGLPQGSPCSPVITNLISHSFDINLSKMAKRYSCTYSRYADDITISTREKIFPHDIMRREGDGYIAGGKLKREIARSGFELNEIKTRIQSKDSRQDVTGLVVNKKPNVKKEYWRTVRSQCHALFATGEFFDGLDGEGKVLKGNINVLEGRLNFIDQLDYFNRLRQKPPLNPEYAIANHGVKVSKLLSGREKTFSKFLYYRLFYGNKLPTILCEGKTDNVYLKTAINVLAPGYPKLARPKTSKEPYRLLVRFLEYSKRTRFLLELDGGTSYLSNFIDSYNSKYKHYTAPKPLNPVIVILDNDSGFGGGGGICSKLTKINAIPYPIELTSTDYRNSNFVHVTHNLYVILTPLIGSNSNTSIEDFFDETTKKIKVSGKSFSPNKKNSHNDLEYGKEIFAKKVVKPKKSSISFEGFRPLLDRIVKVIEHYDSV
jgi:RNA-directed DNA polymerase